MSQDKKTLHFEIYEQHAEVDALPETRTNTRFKVTNKT
jgi:hypothetical protein